MICKYFIAKINRADHFLNPSEALISSKRTETLLNTTDLYRNAILKWTMTTVLTLNWKLVPLNCTFPRTRTAICFEFFFLWCFVGRARPQIHPWLKCGLDTPSAAGDCPRWKCSVECRLAILIISKQQRVTRDKEISKWQKKRKLKRSFKWMVMLTFWQIQKHCYKWQHCSSSV